LDILSIFPQSSPCQDPGTSSKGSPGNRLGRSCPPG
jgi:hypothetical protein